MSFINISKDDHELEHPRPAYVPNFIQDVTTAARINTPEMPSWQRTYNSWHGKVQPYPTLGYPAGGYDVLSKSASITIDDFTCKNELSEWRYNPVDDWSANPAILRTGIVGMQMTENPGGKSSLFGTLHRPFSNNELTNQ